MVERILPAREGRHTGLMLSVSEFRLLLAGQAMAACACEVQFPLKGLPLALPQHPFRKN
jgi:hypothetical protein